MRAHRRRQHFGRQGHEIRVDRPGEHDRKLDETGNLVAGSPTITGLVFERVLANTTAGSNTVAILGSTADLVIGQTVTGPGIVEISSADSVSLTATGPVTLAAQITGAGNSFQLKDTGGTLTVGSPSSTLVEQGIGAPPNQMLSMGGLSGVTTNDGNITLETAVSGGIVIGQPVNAGAGVVTLTSVGTITEPAGGLITTKTTLTGSSIGGASLAQGNRVGTFGPFSNATGGLLSFFGVTFFAGGLPLTCFPSDFFAGAFFFARRCAFAAFFFCFFFRQRVLVTGVPAAAIAAFFRLMASCI